MPPCVALIPHCPKPAGPTPLPGNPSNPQWVLKKAARAPCLAHAPWWLHREAQGLPRSLARDSPVSDAARAAVAREARLSWARSLEEAKEPAAEASSTLGRGVGARSPAPGNNACHFPCHLQFQTPGEREEPWRNTERAGRARERGKWRDRDNLERCVPRRLLEARVSAASSWGLERERSNSTFSPSAGFQRLEPRMAQGRRCCAGILTLQQVLSGGGKTFCTFSATIATSVRGSISATRWVLPRAGTFLRPAAARAYVFSIF